MSEVDVEEGDGSEGEREVSTSEDESVGSAADKTKEVSNSVKRKEEETEEDEDSGEEASLQRRSKTGTGMGTSKLENTGLKLTFRHLPPTLKSDEFLEVLGQIPEYDYYFYKPGEKYRGHMGFSTGMINFLDKDDGLIMEEKFNNYMVVDIKGMEYYMTVTVALNQGIAKQVKVDPVMGTYQETDRYKAFLERYNQLDVGVLGIVLNDDGTITTDLMLREIEEKKERQKLDVEITPLLEFIRDRTVEEKKRRKEMREVEIAKAKEKLRLSKQNDSASPVFKIMTKSYDRDRVVFASSAKPGTGLASLHVGNYNNLAPSCQPLPLLAGLGHHSYGDASKDKKNKDRERKERKEKERRDRRAKESEQRYADRMAKKENKPKDSEDRSFETRKSGSDSRVHKEDTPDKVDKDTKLAAPASDRSDRWKPNSDKKEYPNFKPRREQRDYPKESDSGRRGAGYKDKDQEPGYSRRKPEDEASGRGNRNTRREKDNISTPRYPKKSEENPGSKKPVESSKSEAHSSSEKLQKTEPSKQEASQPRPVSSLDPKEPTVDPEKPESKKRIVKKIIRVRKVKGSETVEEGKEFVPSGESSKPVIVKKIIKKSVPSEVEPKPSEASTSTSKPAKSGDDANKEKRRKDRPDLQIYRPGGMRRGETAGPSSNSERQPLPKPKSERDRERDKERAINRKSGLGYGGGGGGNGKPVKTASTSASTKTESSERAETENSVD